MRPRDQAAKYLQAFGLAVRRRREAASSSQEDLSFRAKLDRTYISGIERGVRNPTLKTILRIAKALNTTAEVLVADAERIFSDEKTAE